MSSILIKDMEIPCEEAEPLRIELYADGTVLVIKEQDDFYEFKAVPVPPHGRLIDGDASEVISFAEEDAVGKDFYDGILYATDFISQQPTIIPAEECET